MSDPARDPSTSLADTEKTTISKLSDDVVIDIRETPKGGGGLSPPWRRKVTTAPHAPSPKDGAAPMSDQPPWHTMTSPEVLAELGVATDGGDGGLTSDEAASRLVRYGPNKMTEARKRTLLERIWAQVANLLVGILVTVAVVSMIRALTESGSDNIVSNWIQVGIIVGVITLNTWIGLLQEGSAEKAAEALKAMLSSDARVIRDGVEKEVPAADVVPGDIILLGLGDRVPADMRMLEVANLACQEAALTGESVPVDKTTDPMECGETGDPDSVPLGDRKNMCFSATLVAQGTGRGVVVSTGDNTQIGTINHLVSKVAKKKSNVLKQIDNVSKWLAFFIVLTAAVTFIVAYQKTDLPAIEAVTIALTCAVAMIPEGLEAIVTVTYAWAVSNMAKHNAIVRVLPAVETLGSVTVICSDKTGTLTKNEMSLTALVTSNKARYKFDVHSTDRTATNFVRDDTYMAERASHALHRSAKSIIMSHGMLGGKAGQRKSWNLLWSTKSFSALRRSFSSFGSTGSRKNESGHSSSYTPGLPLESGEESASSWHPHDDSVQKGQSESDNNAGEGQPAEQQDDEKENSNDMVKDETPIDVSESDADISTRNGQSPSTDFLRSVLAGGILCSKATLGKNGTREGEIGNPTELAIIRAAYFGGVDVSSTKRGAPPIAEVPFSSEYKFMATIHEPVEAVDGQTNGSLVVHVKGAPDRMIPLCSTQARGGQIGAEFADECDEDYWMEQVATLSSHGLRVLALCRGTVPSDSVEKGQQLGAEFVQEQQGGKWLTMVGLCAIMDPPRPECIDAIKVAHKAGVRVAMITGDHKDTALAIGSMLGIVDAEHSSALTGPELDAMADDEIRAAVIHHNVFARASPQNKIRIVKALQAEGQVCGMTGDGVNDAPALKAADMGVAMGKEGTDVAREAAEMILADDNFATIVAAVREGRVVWDNLRKVLMVNTPINNAQGMSVLFGMICGLQDTPLTPIQVLYCNLICAVTLGFVTAVEPAEKGIMDNPPRRVGKRLVGRYLLLRIAIGTATLVACTVGAVFWVRSMGYALGEMRAQASNTLTFGAISITVSARFSYQSALHPRLIHGNKYCWYAVAITAVLQMCITYIPGLNRTIFSMEPQDARQWGIVVLGMIIVFMVMETEKAIRRKLTSLGRDTGDLELDPIFDENVATEPGPLLPRGASRLKLAELPK